MTLEPTMAEEIIETNLKSFLLVLSVSLSVATLPQIFSWFRQIPYTLLSNRAELFTHKDLVWTRVSCLNIV